MKHQPSNYHHSMLADSWGGFVQGKWFRYLDELQCGGRELEWATTAAYHEQRLLSLPQGREELGLSIWRLPRSSTSMDQVGQALEFQVHESDGTRCLWLWLDLA